MVTLVNSTENSSNSTSNSTNTNPLTINADESIEDYYDIISFLGEGSHWLAYLVKKDDIEYAMKYPRP